MIQKLLTMIVPLNAYDLFLSTHRVTECGKGLRMTTNITAAFEYEYMHAWHLHYKYLEISPLVSRKPNQNWAVVWRHDRLSKYDGLTLPSAPKMPMKKADHNYTCKKGTILKLGKKYQSCNNDCMFNILYCNITIWELHEYYRPHTLYISIFKSRLND